MDSDIDLIDFEDMNNNRDDPVRPSVALNINTRFQSMRKKIEDANLDDVSDSYSDM